MSTIYNDRSVCSLFNLTPFFFLENLTVLKRKKRRRKRVKRRKRRAKRSRKRNKPRVRVHPAAHQTAAAATLRMRNPPERKPRRRAREEGTQPVTAALRESRRKNAPTVWTPNTHIQNTMITESRGHQTTSTAERDGGTTKREVKIDTGAGRGGENKAGAGALSDGEMRTREREETGAENVTRARGKEKETLIEMSVGNEGEAVKNAAEVIAEMQRRGQNTAEGNS